ncbi:biotin--[acetyl-CoA-carboxylase] ligase [Nitrospina watsonii]|uniref:biotin--[biotin carboxyl-carrier protein] ligase n=1 Tax=Nitrospina watsonii TaxID=1323948 RepID=A0ABM9HCZ2_9BACT|nr:biotin--[acetyl-CoA-carboxylase] ligase [Nitrospina watsonii]CAI2718081.1 Biotin-protein ligase / Biotin operon repressor [Nitrospina watsonii]
MAYSQEQLDAIQRQRQTPRWARQIIAHDELESTNDLAKKLLADGAEEGTLVLADTQTRGKGRLGRSWFSEKGTGLYFSLILKPALPREQHPSLTLMAAVATVEALQPFSPHPITLKWPNDILLNQRKLGGILSEQVLAPGDTVSGVVVGIGINVNQTRFPEELAAVATSLYIETREQPERSDIFSFIINYLYKYYQILLEDGASPILSRWRQNSRMLGSSILLRQGAETHTGVAIDLDAAGRLVVRLNSGEVRAFDGGEVTLHPGSLPGTHQKKGPRRK